ncbi:MAG: hypothetical protein E7310_08960 [Clostridiales bacterium]|nr:hypothetical protein [Clostridiales bacterium]
MGYLTAKQFSEIWGITERRIIKLCKENRISGARKTGMVWEIPEETLKPSDKRSNIYKYINIQKKIMIVNAKKELKDYLLELLNKEGYVAEFENVNLLKDNLDKYYEGLIYFSTNNMNQNEELYITNFSNKLNSESSIVIVDYNNSTRNKIEQKLSRKFKDEIGLKINTLLLDIAQDNDVLINYDELAEDIINLLLRFKNTTGISITTDGGKIEFNKSGRTENFEIGKFYKAINNCFKKLNKESYLWCASTMLEDEWTDSPQEMKFRLINLEAANRGVNVERIFIFSKEKIKQFKNNKTLKIYMQSNIKTLYVDLDEIKEKEPNLIEVVGAGWDGIDKALLIADLPETSKQRGYISKNTKEVIDAYNCFQKLKTYAKDLKEILK